MKLFRKKIITRFDNKPYLIRYSIFSWLKIHKILLSDDTCLHDHPWAFISFIIRGGYVEERVVKWVDRQEMINNPRKYWDDIKGKNVFNDLNGEDKVGILKKKIYGPGSILFRKAHSTHRLEVYDQPAWTVVITFKKIRMWGFFTPTGWMPWFKYEQENSCGE